MGRKKGFDKNKIQRIIAVLINNEDGIWLRKIASETGLHPSTVSRYIDDLLYPLTDDVSLGEKPILRVIKLKPFVVQKLREGKNINQIMKLLKIFNNI